jgi:hypothetical protein
MRSPTCPSGTPRTRRTWGRSGRRSGYPAVLTTVDNWLTAQDGTFPPEPEDVLSAIANAYASGEPGKFPELNVVVLPDTEPPYDPDADPTYRRCAETHAEARAMVMDYLEAEGELPGGRGSYPPEVRQASGAFQSAVDAVLNWGDPFRWGEDDDFECDALEHTAADEDADVAALLIQPYEGLGDIHVCDFPSTDFIPVGDLDAYLEQTFPTPDRTDAMNDPAIIPPRMPGDVPGLDAHMPTPATIVHAIECDCADCIAGHPLFNPDLILDGQDAEEAGIVPVLIGPDALADDAPYCSAGGCGCGEPDAVPLDLTGLTPFIVVRLTKFDSAPQRWAVKDGQSYYTPDYRTEAWRTPAALDRDAIVERLHAGWFRVESMGWGEGPIE